MTYKTNTPRILVLLAAYNGDKYIEEQLDSILAQEGVEVSVLISLDLSTDRTLEIVHEYESKHSNITLLPYGEKFGSAGKNFLHLILNADFEGFDYVAFSDQDDIWLKEKLAHAVEYIETHKIDAYSANVTAFWEDGSEKLIKKSHPQVEFDYLFESSGPGCTFVLSKSLFSAIKKHVNDNLDKLGLLWIHDWFCYSFARFNNYKWKIDSTPYMLYRQHSANEVGANSGLESFIKRCKVMLGGDGIAHVLNQADFIGQNEIKPIKKLKLGRVGAVWLALNAFKFRRRVKDKVYCFLLFFLLFLFGIKGLKRVNK